MRRAGALKLMLTSTSSITAGRTARGRRRTRREIGGWRAPIIACAALAGLSLLLPSALAYDPWGWLVWGRELTRLALDTTGGASWKPGPVVVTAALAPLGAAAPLLWLALARAAALLALVLAYRLAADLAGDDRRSRRLAGGVAACALALTGQWLRAMAGGLAEPLLVAAVLGAVERHLAGRPRAALGLLFVAALIRVESWPFLAAYALWRWRRAPGERELILVLLAAVPLAWFGADWIGSGSPFTGGRLAEHGQADYRGSLGLPALGGIALLATPPVVAGAAATAWAARRRGERRVTALAAPAACWVAVVVAMAAAGYPGLPRFAYPAIAVGCVLCGAGAAWLREAAGARRGAAIAAAVVAAAILPFAVIGVVGLIDTGSDSVRRARLQGDLGRAIRVAGGREQVRACGGAAVNWGLQSAMAWRLDLPVSRVSTRTRLHGVVFSTPAGAFAARPPGPPVRPVVRRRLATVGRWTVVAVRPALPPPAVSSACRAWRPARSASAQPGEQASPGRRREPAGALELVARR